MATLLGGGGQEATDPRDVSQIKEVVYLGGGGQEALYDRVVHVYRSLSQYVSDRLQFLLKVLEVLVDHGAEDTLDLRLLHTDTHHGNQQTHSRIPTIPSKQKYPIFPCLIFTIRNFTDFFPDEFSKFQDNYFD